MSKVNFSIQNLIEFLEKNNFKIISLYNETKYYKFILVRSNQNLHYFFINIDSYLKIPISRKNLMI